MYGSHLSVAGGVVNALREARRLKMDCVQVFTANQRQWQPRPPSESECQEWLTELAAMGWDGLDEPSVGASKPSRVVSHNSYLTNLASPDDDAWRRSMSAQRAELERCEALHIGTCVMHPGAHLGKARHPAAANVLDGKFTPDERRGLKRLVRALDQIHRDLRGYRVITCLETTVGSGTNLGYDFHQLAFVRANIRNPERLGYCFDTCHVTAAGYDMTSDASARRTIDEFDAICNLANLRVFHLNDSIGAVGSRKDRHAHVGRGCCGQSCFRTIVNRPEFRIVPKILETPKEKTAHGTHWDALNIRRLKRLETRAVVDR